MVEFNLKLTTNSAEHSGSYRILELPPDIHKLIDSTLGGDAGYVFPRIVRYTHALC